jgi:hypothetical protein
MLFQGALPLPAKRVRFRYDPSLKLAAAFDVIYKNLPSSPAQPAKLSSFDVARARLKPRPLSSASSFGQPESTSASTSYLAQLRDACCI